MQEPRHYQNLTNDDDPCEVCFNEGWVIIKGHYRVYGYTYSNGSAPCKWCELGRKTFEAATKRKIRVTDNYRIEHVDGYDPHVEYLPKAEARRLIKQLLAGQIQLPYEEQDEETRRLVKAQLEAKARNYAPAPSSYPATIEPPPSKE